MGLFNFLDGILNGIFGSIISSNPTFGLILIVLLVSIIITLTYKFATNQSLMKDLKEEINSLQKEVKKLSKNPQKAMKVQNEMMEINMKYMMHSMRSTFITFIPIIVIFGWLSSNVAYLPIVPGEEFEVNILFNKDINKVTLDVPDDLNIIDGQATKVVASKKASWILMGEKSSDYELQFSFGDEKISKNVKIDHTKYLKPTMRPKGFIDSLYESTDEYIPKGSSVREIKIGNEPFKANLFGLRIGWLGTYIIFSIIFSMVLRKILKIY